MFASGDYDAPYVCVCLFNWSRTPTVVISISTVKQPIAPRLNKSAEENVAKKKVSMVALFKVPKRSVSADEHVAAAARAPSTTAQSSATER
jgi:hypothetical protein